MQPDPWTIRLRRVAGLGWLCGWVAVLWVVAAPWRDLGGVVSERLRWLEWFVLVVGLTLGFLAGRFARDWARPGTGRAHVHVLRLLLYPLGGVTAAALLALTLLEQRDPAGVVVTAFLAWWGGLDIAFGAVPLLEGEPYGLRRPVDPEDRPDATGPNAEWTPPWERG